MNLTEHEIHKHYDLISPLDMKGFILVYEYWTCKSGLCPSDYITSNHWHAIVKADRKTIRLLIPNLTLLRPKSFPRPRPGCEPFSELLDPVPGFRFCVCDFLTPSEKWKRKHTHSGERDIWKPVFLQSFFQGAQHVNYFVVKPISMT
jgi:hypothetical protein